jgi:hypothetical protein
MYIDTVELSDSYIQGCDAGILKNDEYFIVRRSEIWDLADADERIEAALAFFSVLNYTMNATDGN